MVEVKEGFDLHSNHLWLYFIVKKLDLRELRPPHGIIIKRRPSHVGRENPRTSAPPIHNGTVAHENDRDRALDLCFGVGQTRGFFNHSLKIRSHGESNPGPKECYSDHLTNSARGPFTLYFIV
jgi:hypothetical protein